ncbi:right-handed parallel beta-helix repeat-containing protein [Apibacter raozihei]|uniref:right-handed parallel beta-helix repeat-containing protein n=1 Tax=Apibacter raozihei TaxID=2500547 RepID=UPI000FE41B2C|nr:right-handed parallel beta-helix repeat-containing protein [Apibacter raozihei]
MKKISLFCTLLFFTVLIYSCRDDYKFDSASHPLRFSKDTVMLDTVFAENRSETYVLKVYNQQNEDVTIPRIYLEKGSSSQFKINVDGIAGSSVNNNSFENVPLRAKDSLYIFVEIAPNAITSTEALADEDLLFSTVGSLQKVKLLSLVENADFYFSKSGTREISSDVTWDNSKSKVIYGNLKFTQGAKLTIKEGTRVYLHKNANLIIDEASSLAIEGKLGNEVTIRGDRHDTKYDSLPDNWNQIKLSSGSTASIDYAIIKGGNTGLSLDKNATVSISNTQLYNFRTAGIYSAGAKITGSNVVINNCGSADLYLENGGTYDFTHCSFGNYWNLTAGNAYSLYLSNSYNQSGATVYNALNAIFKNCIFWTLRANSIAMNKNSNAEFVYSFDTNIIKNGTNGLVIDNDPGFKNILVNKDPLFYRTNYSNTLLRLKENSPALGIANTIYSNLVPSDINGVSRITSPSLGAYQK